MFSKFGPGQSEYLLSLVKARFGFLRGREAEFKVWGPVRVSGFILISALDQSQKQTLQIQGVGVRYLLRWGSPRAQPFPRARMQRQWPGKRGEEAGAGERDLPSPCSVSAPELPVPPCLWKSTAILALKAPGAHCSEAPIETCMQGCCVWYETWCRGGMGREGGREMLRIISGLYPRVPFVHISIHSRIKYFLLKHFFFLLLAATPLQLSLLWYPSKPGSKVNKWKSDSWNAKPQLRLKAFARSYSAHLYCLGY